jgi:nucleoside-diphosphate-sugar epimerase
MPSFLVTGCAGFIGSHLAETLLQQGHRVRGVDNLSTGFLHNIQHLPSLDFIQADINDPTLYPHLLQDIDFILHQAAIPSVQRSVENPLRTHHANSTGTLCLLEHTRTATHIQRIVIASSSSVYGNTAVLPKHENMVPAPRSPYAVSKYTCELYAQVYHQMHHVPTVCLRYFNIFGPRQNPHSNYAAVIPKFIHAVLNNTPPSIHGTGKQTRDFTFVSNAVQANILACFAENASGGVYNIACGEQTSLLELLQHINILNQKNIAPVFKEKRAGDIEDSMADISRAQHILGYTNPVSWKQGVQITLENMASSSAQLERSDDFLHVTPMLRKSG